MYESTLRDGSTPRMTRARAEALIRVRDFGGYIKPPDLADKNGYTVQRAHALLKDLERMGYAEIDRDPNGNLAKLTVAGWRAAYLITGGRQGVDAIDGDMGELYLNRLHGVVGRLNVHNAGMLPPDWHGEIRKQSTVQWAHIKEGGDEFWSAVVAGWTVHLRRSSIAVYLREPVEAWTAQGTWRELSRRLQRVADRVRELTGAHVDVGSVEIGRAEVGVEKHHMAVLLDAHPELSLDDVKVMDRETGAVEVEYDRSKGPEMELKGAARAAEIQEAVQAETRQLAHHPDAKKAGHRWERGLEEADIDPGDAVEAVAALVQERSRHGLAGEEEGEEEGEDVREAREDESGWAYVDGGTWRTW